MEIFDIYDENRIKTGRTMLRGDATADGDYRLVIHVCIFSSEGKMLIQQRQPFKSGWSGLWDVSVGGHAVQGDDSRRAAEREVLEELGLELDLKGIRPAITVNWSHGFDDYYVIKHDLDISTLVLQPEEVKTVKWAGLDEIKSMIDDESFIPYHKSFIELLFHLKDHSDTRTRADRG